MVAFRITPVDIFSIAPRPKVPVETPDPKTLEAARKKRLKEVQASGVVRHVIAYCIFLGFTVFLAHHSIDKRSFIIKADLLDTVKDSYPGFKFVSVLGIQRCAE